MKTIQVTISKIPLFFLSFCLLTMLGFSSCDPEGAIDEQISEDDISSAQLEAELELEFEDVEEISNEALLSSDNTIDARTLSSDENDELITRCAVIEHDKVNKTIVVDFGDGCTGPHGRLRSGKIIITYTKWRYLPGAVTTIILDNFYVDEVHVEGTKTITNVSASLLENISLNTTLEGGQATWPDGTVATRSFSYTRTWVRMPNFIKDEFHVEGEAAGSTVEGKEYDVEVLSKLIWKRECRWKGIHVPVQGIKVIKRTGKADVMIDFGDGECDTKATITVNGESKVVDLRRRNA